MGRLGKHVYRLNRCKAIRVIGKQERNIARKRAGVTRNIHQCTRPQRRKNGKRAGMTPGTRRVNQYPIKTLALVLKLP